MASIYTIMVMTKLEEVKKNTGILDFGNSRVIGFYYDEEKAKRAVLNNLCDMNETCYDYAVVECVQEGIYPITKQPTWYRFDYKNNTYKEIEPPTWLDHACNFTIG